MILFATFATILVCALLLASIPLALGYLTARLIRRITGRPD